jgi:hypothetical protein
MFFTRHSRFNKEFALVAMMVSNIGATGITKFFLGDGDAMFI